MTLHLYHVDDGQSRRRYGMLRGDRPGSMYSTYDIVEHVTGQSDRVLATGVRYQAAKEIVDALNLAYDV